jgi:hypothetical protein
MGSNRGNVKRKGFERGDSQRGNIYGEGFGEREGFEEEGKSFDEEVQY